MSYSSIALMAEDLDLRKRIIACAAQEGINDSSIWVNQNLWRIIVAPGWDDAWDSALEVGVDRPGFVEIVISDGMILAAVQSVLAANIPPVP